MNTIKSYKDLLVWQKSMELTEQVYLATADFPQKEMYGLVSQLRRAAVSIPSNIAEGSSRRSTAEFIRFINIASGSLAEVETQLLLSLRLGYLTADTLPGMQNACEEISKMLFALQKSLTEKSAA